MRTSNSIKNILVSMALGFLAIIVSFIAQRIFIQSLGVEYLGLNGLFTNIISMLAIAELGFGSALVYHLYKPIADKDTLRVSSLMKFYRNGYRLVALIVFTVSTLVLPFLPFLVGENNISSAIYIIYLLFVADAVCSYLMSYKRSLLYADQKSYIINIVRIGTTISLNIAQIIVLVMTQNYYLFLIIKILSTVTENLILNGIVRKKYPGVAYGKSVESIDNETRKDIFQKIRGLLYHKSATFVIKGSDNIIISIFLGIKMVGLYANYALITMAITGMMSQVTTAITASVGNLLLDKNVEKQYVVYKNLFLMNFILGSISAIVFLTVADSFITLWIGREFILPIEVLLALALLLYFELIRSPAMVFKTAAGVFHQDRFIPVLESVVSIIASLVLLQFFGLAGVFMGTILSTLVLHLYGYPKYVYRPLFGEYYAGYYLKFFGYFALAFIVGVLTFIISRYIETESGIVEFILKLAVAFSLPLLIYYIVFRKTKEYVYYKNLLLKLLRRKRRNG